MVRSALHELNAPRRMFPRGAFFSLLVKLESISNV
jgi:hypothetical protein